MSYVQTIPYEDSQGDLKEAYDTMTKSRGPILNVQEVSSLQAGHHENPDGARFVGHVW